MRKNFAKIACLGAASLSLLAGCGVIDQLKEGRGLGKVTESAAADSESAEEEILMEDDFAEIPVSGAWIPDSVDDEFRDGAGSEDPGRHCGLL